MKIGFINESCQDHSALECRVAITPQSQPFLVKQGIELIGEAGAGLLAGFRDEAYVKQNIKLLPTAKDVLNAAQIVVHISPLTFETVGNFAKLNSRRLISIGNVDSLWSPDQFKKFGSSFLTAFSLDLMPRISRAQSMDILSAFSTILGYESVIEAAKLMNRVFPLLTTAAGTLPAAKVLVLGAGVAGLQAMATAKRLGALVLGYDVRPVTTEQIMSVGAKPLLTSEQLSVAIKESDAVITTALTPGMKAPILISQQQVAEMKTGAVIVDLAAERGGNCELTVAGQTIVVNDVHISGPLNLTSRAAFNSSQMFMKNVMAFLKLANLNTPQAFDLNDEIFSSTLISPVANLRRGENL